MIKKTLAIALIVVMGLSFIPHTNATMKAQSTPSLPEIISESGHRLGEMMGEAMFEKMMETLREKIEKPFVYNCFDIKWGMSSYNIKDVFKTIDSNISFEIKEHYDDGKTIVTCTHDFKLYISIPVIYNHIFTTNTKYGLFYISTTIVLNESMHNPIYLKYLIQSYYDVRCDLAYCFDAPTNEEPIDKNPNNQWCLSDGTIINATLIDTGDPSTSMINITYQSPQYNDSIKYMEYINRIGTESEKAIAELYK